jgi:hypothetical protein
MRREDLSGFRCFPRVNLALGGCKSRLPKQESRIPRNRIGMMRHGHRTGGLTLAIIGDKAERLRVVTAAVQQVHAAGGPFMLSVIEPVDLLR